jgi:UDP-N-acetylglucosamine acyltransferase
MSNFYFDEAYKKYKKYAKNDEFNINIDQIDKFSNALRDGENLTIMRFNDGEWAFSYDIAHYISSRLKIKHTTEGAEIDLRYAGRLLKRIVESNPEYYVSVDSNSLTNLKFKEVIDEHIDKFTNRIGGGVFNIWSLYTGFNDLFDIFKQRKMLVVGPEFLNKLPFKKDHIVLDEITAVYDTQKYAHEVLRYLDKNYEPNMIIVYSCSFIAKVAINEIYNIYGDDITQLDMGASLNPYVGYSNRPWHELMITKLTNDDFYKSIEIDKSSIVSKNAIIGENVKIGKNCVIDDGVIIGENTIIKNFVELRSNTIIGENCFIDSKVSTSGNCEIGNNVTLRYDVIIARGCKIGDNTYIAPRVMTNNLDHGKKQIGGAKIGKNCFIGTNAVLQHGINIEDNAIIGAMSFVTKNIPKGETWIGIPAKKLDKND